MRFTARPRMGGRRAVCDGIVVILVVADPLWGAGPAPSLRGRAVTVNKFLLFHASDVFGQEIQAFSSISSVRCAEVVGVRRGAESVIGNLLASGQTFRTRSARL